MFINSKKSNSGFTLLETLIAITVVSSGIIGAFMAIQSGIKAIDYSNARFVAAALAQEGVEIIKNIRDNNILQYKYVSANTPWDQHLLSGGEIEKNYEARYDDIFKPHFFLTPSGSNPEDLNFLKKQSPGFYNYDIGDNTRFKRKINIQKISDQEIKVEVTVYWTIPGGGYNELSIVQHIYRWRQ